MHHSANSHSQCPKDYHCPACGGSDFKEWKLPHPLILHWVLNPGLAVNELLLGQRLPTVQLICKGCKVVLLDRTYVPCSSCHALHPAKLEGGRKGFGLWRGMACPDCGAAIPCLWNIFSMAILAITFPVWALPYFLYFRHKPRVKLARYAESKAVESLTRGAWVKMGALFALLMWVMLGLLPYLVSAKSLEDLQKLGTSAIMWSVGGLAFGVMMSVTVGRKIKAIE